MRRAPTAPSRQRQPHTTNLVLLLLLLRVRVQVEVKILVRVWLLRHLVTGQLRLLWQVQAQPGHACVGRAIQQAS